METLFIELTNPKARNLLQELEELHLIKVIKKGDSVEQKPSRKLRGSISAEATQAFNEEIDKSRNEWNRPSI